MSEQPTIDELRDVLRGWGKYGPHFDERGRWIGSWWERFPIDEMTDEQVVEAARAIATREENG